MHISGTEPSSVILSQTMEFKTDHAFWNIADYKKKNREKKTE